jgi:DNA-directed RNA polymerase subunit RPC12/RpoP
MIEIILGLALIVFIVFPIIYLIYSLRSKHYPCPYCGNKILKSDRICVYCSENLEKLDTPDRKITTIGKSFREGADIAADPDQISKRFEKSKSRK